MPTLTWQGGASGNWSAGFDWSGGAAPQAGDTVVIGDGVDVTLDTTGAALNVTVGIGSTLELPGTLDLGGTLSGGRLNLTGTLVGGTLETPLVDVPYYGHTGLLDGVDYQGGRPLGGVTITVATALATLPLPIVSSGSLILAAGTYDGAFTSDLTVGGDSYFGPLFGTTGNVTLGPDSSVTVKDANELFSGTGTVTNLGSISLGGDTAPQAYTFGNVVGIDGYGFVNAGVFTIMSNAGTPGPVPTGLDVSAFTFDNTGTLTDLAGTVSVGSDSFHNSGTISAAQIVVGARVSDFANTGSLVAGSIVIADSVTLSQLAGVSGVLTISGTLDLQGATLDAGAFGAGLTVTGTVENGTLTATGGTLTLNGATLSKVQVQPGGTVVTAGPITLIDPPVGVGLTLDGTTTEIQTASGTTLVTLAIAGPSVTASGTMTLTGGLQVSESATGVAAGDVSAGGGSVISGSLDVQAGTLDINAILAGDYQIALGAGAALVLDAQRLFGPPDGSVILLPAATLDGNGTITLGAGASATIDAMAITATPTFAFTGAGQVVLPGVGAGVTLQGLQAGDQIDLKGLSSVGGVTPSAVVVGGTLEITSASGETASLALIDPPANATFLVLNDGLGGTLIADPPLPPLTATTDFFGTPGTDFGSYGLDGGTLAGGDVTMEGTYAVDLLNHASWQIGTLGVGLVEFFGSGPNTSLGGGGALLIDGGAQGGTLTAGAILLGGTFDQGGTTGDLTAVDRTSIVTDQLGVAFSSVSVDATSSVLVGSGTAVAGAVTVADGATLNAVAATITGNLIDNGMISISGFFDTGQVPTLLGVTGDVTVTSTLQLGDYGGLSVGGTLTVRDGGRLVDSGSPATGLSHVASLVLGHESSGGGDIASNGTLTVLGDRGTIAALALHDGSLVSVDQYSSLVVGGGTATAGALTIGAGATLSADIGTIDGTVIDQGAFSIAAAMSVIGDLTLDSAFTVAAGATLTVASGQRIGALGVLTTFGGALSGQMALHGAATIEAVAGTAAITDSDGRLTLAGADFTGLKVSQIATGTADLTKLRFSTSFGENVDRLTLDGAVFEVAPNSGKRLFTASDGHGGTLVTAEAAQLACFAAGTRIRTEHGERAVETLQPGALVRTAAGRLAPVAWVGWTRVNLARHPDAARAAPVRIMADAIAPGIPSRALLLSRDHAIYLDGALIPVWQLANGATIARDDTPDSVTYWHVELDRHDIIVAEGLATESYLDTGNRGLFANASGARALHPEFAAPDADALAIWAERAAAPLLLDGPIVAAHRARLRARAQTLGWREHDGVGLRLRVGDTRHALRRLGDLWRVRLPAGIRAAVLDSHSFVPAERARDSGDLRRLGAPVASVTLNGQDVRFGSGWHAPDTAGTVWRWSDGQGEIALPPTSRSGLLEVRLAFAPRSWQRAA